MLSLSVDNFVSSAVSTKGRYDIDLFEPDRLFLINGANITNNNVFINHQLMDVGDINASFFTVWYPVAN